MLKTKRTLISEEQKYSTEDPKDTLVLDVFENEGDQVCD